MARHCIASGPGAVTLNVIATSLNVNCQKRNDNNSKTNDVCHTEAERPNIKRGDAAPRSVAAAQRTRVAQ